MHPPRRLHRPECSLATLSPESETGAPARTRTSNLRLRKAECRTLTPREQNRASCRSCTDTVSLEETLAAVTPMTRSKMVAASGIAPNSPRLQRGANLSQLHSRCGPSARYGAVVFRLSGGCSALELRRNEKWSPDSRAPKAARDRLLKAARRASEPGGERVNVMLPGPPDVSRPLCF